MLAGLVIIILAVMLLVTQILRTRDRNKIKDNHATIEFYNKTLADCNEEKLKLDKRNRELSQTINGLRQTIANVETALRGVIKEQ